MADRKKVKERVLGSNVSSRRKYTFSRKRVHFIRLVQDLFEVNPMDLHVLRSPGRKGRSYTANHEHIIRPHKGIVQPNLNI